MPKFTREAVNAFQERLNTIDASWQQEMNLRETIFQSYSYIKRAREFKASWEQIAEILMEVSNTQDKINPESIRQYYFEISNSDELQAKYKCSLKKISRKLNPRSSSAETPKIQTGKSERPVDNIPDSPAEKDNFSTDISSQFNLSRLQS